MLVKGAELGITCGPGRTGRIDLDMACTGIVLPAMVDGPGSEVRVDVTA